MTTSVSDLEEGLARFISTESPVPSVAELEQASRHLADLIGVSVAGVQVPEFQRLRSLIPEAAPNQPDTARIWGTTYWAPRREAGLLNGFAGHVHDFDDDEVEYAMAHITVTALTAAIVCADGRKSVTGREVLVAYLVATEAAMRIGEIVNPGHYRRGWHASATLGVFAACAAAGRLMGASPVQMGSALGMCGSFAAGIRANFGSDTKPLQVGLAVRNGIFAVEAAMRGLTSTAGSLLGPTGFGSLFQQDRDIATIIDGFGKPYRFLGGSMTIKAYPCCTATHSAIFSVLHLRREHGFSGKDVVSIDCHIDPTVPGILIYDQPVTGTQAKFSMQYCLAVAALRGAVGVEEFTDELVQAPELRSLMERVNIIRDPGLPKGPSGTSVASRVEISLASGKRHVRFQEFVPGCASNPLSDEALKAKFASCLTGVPSPVAGDLFDALLGTDSHPSFTALLAEIPPANG